MHSYNSNSTVHLFLNAYKYKLYLIKDGKELQIFLVKINNNILSKKHLCNFKIFHNDLSTEGGS